MILKLLYVYGGSIIIVGNFDLLYEKKKIIQIDEFR